MRCHGEDDDDEQHEEIDEPVHNKLCCIFQQFQGIRSLWWGFQGLNDGDNETNKLLKPTARRTPFLSSPPPFPPLPPQCDLQADSLQQLVESIAADTQPHNLHPSCMTIHLDNSINGDSILLYFNSDKIYFLTYLAILSSITS